MITSGKYINFIIEAINVLRQELISRNGLGLTDENIHIENFVCYLLNLCFGYELKNLNEETANHPGIDLGDVKKGIGFAITSTKTSVKVNTTLDTVLQHNINEKYPRINIFITTAKQDSYTITSQYQPFNPDVDILDFDDLYKKALYLDVAKQEEIASYIHTQMPYVSKSIGLDYFSPHTLKRHVAHFEPSDWENERLTIEHNFGYMPQVCVMDSDGNEVVVAIQRNEKTVIIGASVNFSGSALLS